MFYTHLFEWANLIYEGAYAAAVDEAVPVDGVPRWSLGVYLNWAENILFSRSNTNVAGIVRRSLAVLTKFWTLSEFGIAAILPALTA